MFFIILGTALFYIIENANSLENFFSGNLTSLDYTGLFFAIIDFIVFIITIWFIIKKAMLLVFIYF